jgi:hypothetical protein
MQIVRTMLMMAAALAILTPPPAVAQPFCPEGRTAQGSCVDAGLASDMRERVRVFTQPRISYTGPVVAPDRERRYDVLRDWGQGLRRETFGPCGAQGCLP